MKRAKKFNLMKFWSGQNEGKHVSFFLWWNAKCDVNYVEKKWTHKKLNWNRMIWKKCRDVSMFNIGSSWKYATWKFSLLRVNICAEFDERNEQTMKVADQRSRLEYARCSVLWKYLCFNLMNNFLFSCINVANCQLCGGSWIIMHLWILRTCENLFFCLPASNKIDSMILFSLRLQ